MSQRPLSLFEKVWNQHVVTRRDDGACLLWIDRHFVHEGSFHGFNGLAARGERVARPEFTFGIADHYVPTRNRTGRIADDGIRSMVEQLETNTAQNGVHLFGLDDPRQGIVHVVGPEQGLILPGCTVVCGDSHTSTNGAFGAIAFGIGASEVTHVLMTQTLWQKPPARLRVRIDGATSPGVGAKDIALSVIMRLGANGARGHAIEYVGSTVRDLSMEGRLTLCNMSIEAGARCAMIAPDATTIAYLEGRPYAPKGDLWARAVDAWLSLASDGDAAFDREISQRGEDVAPIVTWGISPEEALPISETVPDPSLASPEKAARMREAQEYMGLSAGQRLSDIAIDQVFIGSCTNSRIEDLRAAAGVLAGRRAVVPGLVSPGSSIVKRQAEQEGLDVIFTRAGLEWGESGCSMCVGMNGDLVAPGKRCASTTNRNFRGRQGPGSRTHLMSPAMVAAAAVTGHLTDVRQLLEGRGQ